MAEQCSAFGSDLAHTTLGPDWPAFLVTAPHDVAMPSEHKHSRLPYGLWHARKVGSFHTVCGMSAVTWHYFWTLDFEDAGPNTCPECARHVGISGS